MLKVSVIIPIHNCEKYLEDTINSVKEQFFTKWECILINDGSTDLSESIALKSIKNDDRFKYVYQKNKGVCSARNNAVKIAKGEYILFLDGDDLISKNFLEETVKILESNLDVKVVTSTVKYFGRGRGTLKVDSYDLSTLLAANQLVVTSLFRKLDFERVHGFNENMKGGLEDWDFWISILKSGGKIECATTAFFHYRLRAGSRNTGVSFENEKRLRQQIWQNHKELFSQYFVDPTKCLEYKRYADSIEYKVGALIIKPIRIIKNFIFSF